MKRQLEEVVSYVKRLNSYLSEVRSYVYRRISDEPMLDTGTLPLIDSLITVVDDLNQMVDGDINNIDLISSQTKLHSLTNQSVFDLQQIQGVSDSFKVVKDLKISQINESEAYAKMLSLQEFICDSVTDLSNNQKALNINIADNEKCFQCALDVIGYSLDKLSHNQQVENVVKAEYRPEVNYAQEIQSTSDRYLMASNSIMEPLFEDLVSKIRQIGDCNYFDYEQLRMVGMAFINSMTTMKDAWAHCVSLSKEGIQEVFEQSLRQKVDALNNQMSIASIVGVNSEYYNKISNSITAQLDSSATHLSTIIKQEIGDYKLPTDLSSEINGISEKQSQLLNAISNIDMNM